MWGDPEKGMLGTLPATLLAILNDAPEDVRVITMGSGGSRRSDGAWEGEVIRDLFISRFDDFEVFTAISSHPMWDLHKKHLLQLAEQSVLDLMSQNTTDEIANAAKLFSELGITKVLEITGASHGPRCQLAQGAAREARTIPAGQYWTLITDDIPYANTKVSDTAVFEEPHRGDDPVLKLPHKYHGTQVFKKLYEIPPHKRGEFLRGVADLADAMKNSE
jgi:hypothetical protein